MAAVTKAYESRVVQNYGGRTEMVFKLDGVTAADTFVLGTIVYYKGTAAEVAAGDLKAVSQAPLGADIETRYAQTTDDGVTVDLALSTNTFTLGAGPSSDEVAIRLLYKN